MAVGIAVELGVDRGEGEATVVAVGNALWRPQPVSATDQIKRRPAIAALFTAGINDKLAGAVTRAESKTATGTSFCPSSD